MGFQVQDNGFAFAVLGSSLVVLKIGEGTPPTEFWDQYVEAVAGISKTHTVRVFADGSKANGRPQPTQRKQLSDAVDETRVRAAMLTDNPIVRGVATIFRWLNYQNEAFSTRDVEKALDYLWCDAQERAQVLELLPHLK